MHRRRVLRSARVVAGALWLLVAGQAAPVAAQIRPLSVDVVAGSGQPRLSRTPSGDVVLSWLEPGTAEGQTRLRMSVRPAGGQAWSTPRTVTEGANWFVNWADVPGVVAISDTTWAAQWLERSSPESPYAYDVRVALSHDAGRTWSTPIAPHTDGTLTEHGFVSFFPWPSAAGSTDVGLVWLDGREMKPGTGHGVDGNMTLRTARLTADGALHDERVLDSRVCECCPTAATATADGVIVAYRNRGDDETRDIHVVRHAGTWHPDHVAVADSWKIAACPVNGPALSSRDREVAMAWFTAVDDQPRVKVAVSRDVGRSWQSPATIDEGRPLGRVGVAHHPAGGVVVSWLEAEDTGASVRVRRVQDGGRVSPSIVAARVAQSRLSGYPRLSAAADGLVLAWVEGERGATRVVTAIVPFNDVP